MKIPFVNLAKQYRDNKKEIDRALQLVFTKGHFILAEQVKLFEKEFASYLGTRFAVGVASGTDALVLALRALNVEQNDEVIIPANSYPTAFAIAATGAEIKLVDVDAKTYNIDTDKIEKVITDRTRVIVPVHLYGQTADLQPILNLAKKYKLYVVEDAAQAHGALYYGKRVGTIGDIGCFSFYPTKNLGGFGDGGMVVTNNKKLAETIKQLRVYGEKDRYQSLRLGINSRLDELQAAVLRVKLKKLNFYNLRRLKIAKRYHQLLKGLPLVLPQSFDNGSHVYHLFVVTSEKRNQLTHFLKKNGVATEVRYPTPIHLVKSFKHLGYKKGDFPVAERLSKKTLALPCYAELSDKEVETICALVKRFFSR